ncbi:hypothetical protein HK100_006453 [Physocladia obscura]|uniref:Uncharacterized protein n=1 Tax=Physocladia obscura TaxID=109957 RepID=A0AAD5TB23_9FUNG|nr:hypothetical protein HK100_006453 [Physocladia obscura]
MKVAVGGFASNVETRESLPPLVSKLLDEYPALVTLGVQWGDQDVHHNINNVAYARYFESARIRMFDAIREVGAGGAGFAQFVSSESEQTMIGETTRNIAIRYKARLFYPDTVTAGCRVVDVDDFSVYLELRLISHKSNKVVAEGTATNTNIDFAKSRKVPYNVNVANAYRELIGWSATAPGNDSKQSSINKSNL